MPGQRGFGNDGTETARLCQPDQSHDQMKEDDDDVAHSDIVSKPQRSLEFSPILYFATHMFIIGDDEHPWHKPTVIALKSR
jgi:hypothetical protein